MAENKLVVSVPP